MKDFVQILDFAIFQSIMNIAKFTITGLEGPLLMGVKISEADVVDDNIFNQCIAA
jgi:hypothetical protein